MHESYRYAQDIYETIAPELRRILASRAKDDSSPVILPGPVMAKAKELFPLWTNSLEQLEARGGSTAEVTGK